MDGAEPLGDFHAVHAWHPDIKQYDVWFEVGDGLECAITIIGFAADFIAIECVHQPADAFAGKRFVIGNENLLAGGVSHVCGSETVCCLLLARCQGSRTVTV